MGCSLFLLIGEITLAIPVEEAVCPVTPAQVGAFWEAFTTHRHNVGTARVEATAARWTYEAGDLATSLRRCRAMSNE